MECVEMILFIGTSKKLEGTKLSLRITPIPILKTLKNPEFLTL
jgi:hypothetical protein